MYSANPRVIFDDRRDAGKRLAERLQEYSDRSVVVLAIPNGGVPVAVEVASALNADFGLVIARKLPIPLTPEAGFGAITEDGSIILNEELVKRFGLSRQQIEYEAGKVKAEIKRRNLLYLGDKPLVSVSGKTVIIIDDGLASGITMRAAVESVRRRRPGEIVAATPCASAPAVKQVEKAADRVVTCVTGSMPRFAIADFYRHWYDLSDDEVIRYLNRWRARRLH